MHINHDLALSSNRDLRGHTLAVLHNTVDDGGGGSTSAKGAAYLQPFIDDALNSTGVRIEQLGVVELREDTEPEKNTGVIKNLRNIVNSTRQSMSHVEKALLAEKTVLSLGGNHVRGLDALGMLKACHKMGIKPGIVWVDAHPDANVTDGSEGRHVKDQIALHGMVSSVIMGQGPSELLALMEQAPFLDPKNILFIGLNAIDHEKNADGSPKENTELTRLRTLIGEENCITMETLKTTKSQNIVPESVKHKIDELNARCSKLWVEWDVDSVDKEDMPAEVMDNENGLSAEQIDDLFNYIGSTSEILGIGVSELDPSKDVYEKSARLVALGIARLMGISNIKYAKQMAGIDPSKQFTRKPRMPRWLKRTLTAGTTAATVIIGAIVAFFSSEKPNTSMQAKTHLEKFDRSGFPKGTGFCPCLTGEWSKHAGTRLGYGSTDHLNVFTENFTSAARKYTMAASAEEKNRILEELLTYVAAAELQAGDDDRKKTAIWATVRSALDPGASHALQQKYGTAARTGSTEGLRRWMVKNEYL